MSKLKCPESIKYTQISKTTRASHGLVYLKKITPRRDRQESTGPGAMEAQVPEGSFPEGTLLLLPANNQTLGAS